MGPWQKIMSSVLTVSALVALGVAGGTDASASSSEAFENYAISKCATPSGANTYDGTQVTLWDCNGDASQLWHSYLVGSGYELVNDKSGRCLTPYGGSSINGADLVLWDCNGSPGQLWGNDPLRDGMVSNGYSKFITPYGGSTANGAYLTQWEWNGSAGQQWFI